MPPKNKKYVSQAKLEAAAAVLNIDLSALTELIPTPEAIAEQEARKQREAETVLAYLESKGEWFQEKTCKRCNKKFASTLDPVAYCSEPCRMHALEAMGIKWNPNRRTDLQRWNGKIPKVVGARAYEVVQEVLENE